MSGGGKGGKQTTEVKIPAWLESAAQANIARANQIAGMDYTPYYGPDVAAMTPQQIAAIQGTNQAASAFGTPTADPMAGMPTAGNYGGMSAYSSGGLYDQALVELAARNPEQFAFLSNLSALAAAPPARTKEDRPDARRIFGFGSSSDRDTSSPVVSSGGGYTSFRDMFDGGGPGTSGDTFSGGIYSNRLNNLGIKPAGSSGSSSGMGGGK